MKIFTNQSYYHQKYYEVFLDVYNSKHKIPELIKYKGGALWFLNLFLLKRISQETGEMTQPIKTPFALEGDTLSAWWLTAIHRPSSRNPTGTQTTYTHAHKVLVLKKVKQIQI